jgi:hypothetical protein
MYKSLVSFNLNLGRLNKSLRNICLCTIVNISLILFIIVVSFYLIRRLNRNNDNNDNNDTNGIIETFRTRALGGGGVCKPTINFDTKPLVSSLNNLTGKLSSIDAKLDYVTGFKNVKSDKKDNRTTEVSRKNYPGGRGKPVDEE